MRKWVLVKAPWSPEGRWFPRWEEPRSEQEWEEIEDWEFCGRLPYYFSLEPPSPPNGNLVYLPHRRRPYPRGRMAAVVLRFNPASE